MAQNIPGDVQIKTVSIYVNAGVINMTEHCKYIDVYESILAPGVMAEIKVDDTKNLLTNLPILGGEKIVLEFVAPDRNTRHYDLVISGVADGSPSNNQRAKSYTLTAVSEEVLADKTVQICKSYNTNISSMISDICKSYLKTTKTIDVQTTRGVQKILVNSKRPYETIKMLRKRSMSSSDKSSMYVFFENIDGLHFKTIENLFSSGSVGDRSFISDDTRRTDMTQGNFRNILAHSEPEQVNLNDRLMTGGLAHEVKRFDMKTLDYKTAVTTFDASNYKSADGTFKSPDNSITPIKYKGSGSDSWVLNDSGNPDTYISDGLGARKNMVALMGQGFLNLHVFGDSELSAGQMIEINIAENTMSNQAPSAHRQLSGKYIIAYLRHIITPEGSAPRYTCSIEALKGGYKETV